MQAPVYPQPPPGTIVAQAQYPQPPPGAVVFGGAQPAPVVQTVVVSTYIRYGRDPMDITCPHCQSHIRTSTKSRPGAMGEHLPRTIFICVR